MRKFSTKSFRLAALAVLLGVSALLVSDSRVFGGASETQRPELGSWGVDLTTRNPDIKPGDDFFRHANGRWLDTFEIPADLPAYGSFTVLTLRSEDQIKAIIEEQSRTNGAVETNGQKIAELYGGFTDVEALNAKGMTPLASYFKKIDAAKSHEDIAALMGELGRVNGGGSYRGAATLSSSSTWTRMRKSHRSTFRTSCRADSVCPTAITS
jgi:hypothetical protein